MSTYLKRVLDYLFKIGISVDQLANTILAGEPDETLSSRAYRADNKGRLFGRFFRPLIDGVFFLQESHCAESYLSEVKRRQLPAEFQEV